MTDIHITSTVRSVQCPFWLHCHACNVEHLCCCNGMHYFNDDRPVIVVFTTVVVAMIELIYCGKKHSFVVVLCLFCQLFFCLLCIQLIHTQLASNVSNAKNETKRIWRGNPTKANKVGMTLCIHTFPTSCGIFYHVMSPFHTQCLYVVVRKSKSQWVLVRVAQCSCGFPNALHSSSNGWCAYSSGCHVFPQGQQLFNLSWCCKNMHYSNVDRSIKSTFSVQISSWVNN